MKKQAEGGSGYAAAFLYAVEGNAEYVPTATQWLLRAYGPNAYWVKKYSERLGDPEYFKGGQKDLADVYYGIDTQKIIAFDWVHDGLSEEDRRTIRNGLLTCARYRIRAMDRWTQTPNLVFKPTYVVALTGLVTRDQQCLQWGFRRTKPWGPHIGGYFTVLNHMLYDGGPWHESPIYPIAHLDLILSARMSRFLGLADGQDWFNHKLPGGGSPRGLMDYYLDTAYPIEQVGDVRRVRVANYGDGSTNGNGDLFLMHTGESDKKGNILVHQPLAAAYNVSGDPRYAAFLAMLPDYQPSLWESRPLVARAPLPPAPSKIWPRYGLAMLRSDESPSYWTSGDALAVFQIMSQGYGHDHRDKFGITLHGAGRLFYPDYNAIQYENMAIGWTRNSVAHNTLLVDEQDTRNAEPTEIRHDFNSDVKFLATSATGVFEGVDQTRALLLTPEYLLDIFHAASPIPHTYDYLLHSFGKARPVTPTSYRPSDLMKRRFWLVDNQRTATTPDAWSLDFVVHDEPAARLRLTMAAEPDTNVTIGNWGEELASLARQRHQGVEMDRLSMLAVRRRGVRQTTFVATHEPTKKNRTPRITKVTKIDQRHDGVLVRVDATDFTDYVAVRFEPTRTTTRSVSEETTEGRLPRVAFESPTHFASVESYGYLRVKSSGEMIGRGGWLGFRLPLDRRVTRLTLNGRSAKVTRTQSHLAFGETSQDGAAYAAPPPKCPFPATVSPAGPWRMFRRDRREITLELKNTLQEPIIGHVEFTLPAGVSVTPAKPSFSSVAPGETVQLPVMLTTQDPVAGRHTLLYQIAWTSGDEPPVLTAAQPAVVFAGPTLLNEFANRRASYVLHSPKFTARFDMFHGLCRYLADDDGAVRLDGAPLFTFSDGETPMLHAETKHAFTWPREAPADLVAHAYDKCRWQALFFGGRMAIRMDRGWTQFERAHFTVPGKWKSPGGQPRWKRIVAVNSSGKEQDVRPGRATNVAAAELEFPAADWNLGFKFEPPQDIRFNGLEMKFTIGSLTGDNWQVGFCRPGQFDAWRGK